MSVFVAGRVAAATITRTAVSPGPHGEIPVHAGKSDKPEKGAIGPTPIRAVGIGRHPLEHQLPYGRPRTHPGDIAIEPVENAVVPGLGTQFGQAAPGQQVVRPPPERPPDLRQIDISD